MLLLILMKFHLSVFSTNHILSLIRPKKKCIFGIHDPLGLRYLFQLRAGLSSSRYHKKCHNFFDTPTDKCLCNQGIEDTNRFLFLCPFFCYSTSNFTKIWSGSLRKPITPEFISAPHHRIHKIDSTLFNVSLFPYPIHPIMSQSHSSFITYFPLCFYIYASLVFTFFFNILVLCCNFLV